MRRAIPALAAILLAGLLPAPPCRAAVAEENDGPGVVVVDVDGRRCAVTLAEGQRLRIVSGDGDEEVVEIDLSGIGEMVEAALASLGEALGELDRTSIELDLDREGSLKIRDGRDEVIVDVGAIMEAVGQTVAQTFADLDAGIAEWTEESIAEGRLDRGERRNRESEALREELDRLRQEMTALQQELRRIRQRTRH